MNNPEYLIIGKGVSRNARSPLLWNQVFKKLGSSSRMNAVDIELTGPKDFSKFIESNPHLRGLAVGYPNKFHVESFLSPNNVFPLGINVVRIKDGQIQGMNFDGLGAFNSLQSHMASSTDFTLTDCMFYIFGTGSTARSFQSILIKKGITRNSVMFVSSRDENHENIQGSKTLYRKFIKSQDSRPIILVNATPLGSKSFPNLAPFDSDLLQNLRNTKKLVFDFNYGVIDSGPSVFAKVNRIVYLNGLSMNLYQAAHSFDFATFSGFGLRIEQILDLMREIK